MRKQLAIMMAMAAAVACHDGSWVNRETYTDAFMLGAEVRPSLSFDGDSVYTIHDWYGVSGYDVDFVLSSIEDSTTIDILGAESYSNGFYYVPTGLPDAPTAGISPGLFDPNHTILSGFFGDSESGRLWSYVYLYDSGRNWVGGHYYTLQWGEAPAEPVWTAEGECTLPGDPAGRRGVLEAYADGTYKVRDWYGVPKYDLDFAVRPDGGIRMLDYYAEEPDGSVWVQARRQDLGDPLIPQREPNGGLELSDTLVDGAPAHGRLHFALTIHNLEDRPLENQSAPGFVFEW